MKPRFVIFGWLVLLVGWTFLSSPSGFHLWFYDVGQGDAAMFQWDGDEMVVDGGPDRTLIQKLGFSIGLWDRRIEKLVLTHGDADHLTGFVDLMDRYRVGMLITSSWNKSTPEAVALRDAVHEYHISTSQAIAEMRVELPQGWQAIVSAPLTSTSIPNDRSLVMLVTNGKQKILMMGDATSAVEEMLLEKYPNFFPVDILKVGHHGSCTSSSEEFLKRASPKFAVISVGENNRYGHPCSKALERLQSLDIRVLRTDELGDLHFVLKNSKLTLKNK